MNNVGKPWHVGTLKYSPDFTDKYRAFYKVAKVRRSK